MKLELQLESVPATGGAGKNGPLGGLRIMEFAGLGPAPFCAMMLADHGADVLRIDRLTANPNQVGVPPEADFVNRSRRSIAIDLKQPAGTELARAIVRGSDGVIEGFRPGVMERLGLGPNVLIGETPKLVYGRLTGWGRSGPYTAAPGHDINYIALSGALHGIGRTAGLPVPPLNLVGDYAGGSMMLAFGMLAALRHANATGEGQVVDAAMIKGAALLTTFIHSMMANGDWVEARGSNLLDSGAPFYDTYETADGLHVSIGPIEPSFYRAMLEKLGKQDDETLSRQNDRSLWPEQRELLRAIFKSRTRAEWDVLLGASDACYAPVLSMSEAAHHPQNAAIGAFAMVDGRVQPAPAPVYSKSATTGPVPLGLGDDVTLGVLSQAGFGEAEARSLMDAGIVA